MSKFSAKNAVINTQEATDLSKCEMCDDCGQCSAEIVTKMRAATKDAESNPSLRASGVSLAERAGIKVSDIVSIGGHRKIVNESSKAETKSERDVEEKKAIKAEKKTEKDLGKDKEKSKDQGTEYKFKDAVEYGVTSAKKRDQVQSSALAGPAERLVAKQQQSNMEELYKHQQRLAAQNAMKVNGLGMDPAVTSRPVVDRQLNAALDTSKSQAIVPATVVKINTLLDKSMEQAAYLAKSINDSRLNINTQNVNAIQVAAAQAVADKRMVQMEKAIETLAKTMYHKANTAVPEAVSNVQRSLKIANQLSPESKRSPLHKENMQQIVKEITKALQTMQADTRIAPARTVSRAKPEAVISRTVHKQAAVAAPKASPEVKTGRVMQAAPARQVANEPRKNNPAHSQKVAVEKNTPSMTRKLTTGNRPQISTENKVKTGHQNRTAVSQKREPIVEKERVIDRRRTSAGVESSRKLDTRPSAERTLSRKVAPEKVLSRRVAKEVAPAQAKSLAPQTKVAQAKAIAIELKNKIVEKLSKVIPPKVMEKISTAAAGLKEKLVKTAASIKIPVILSKTIEQVIKIKTVQRMAKSIKTLLAKKKAMKQAKKKILLKKNKINAADALEEIKKLFDIEFLETLKKKGKYKAKKSASEDEETLNAESKDLSTSEEQTEIIEINEIEEIASNFQNEIEQTADEERFQYSVKTTNASAL